MKTLKHLALCLAAAFIATGCSNDENEPKNGATKEGKPVKFEMNIGNANTRTVTTGSGNNRNVTWREGDAVGIFVYDSNGTPTEYINKKYEYDGSEWIASGADDAITLPEEGEYNFYAYYPYSASVASPAAATLTVQQDQASTDGDNGNTKYDLSDILTAKVENVTNEGNIVLQYKHAFSMVEVLVSGDLVQQAPTQVILKGVATSASVNLQTNEVSAPSDNADVSMCPVKSENTQTTYLYRAIVPAQKIEANKTLLEVYGVGENQDKNYRFTHTADVPYEQGKYRRISVLIGKNNAGITIPEGAIDEWTPSGKVDVPGEEITINLITVPISSLSTVDVITGDEYKKYTGDQWYISNSTDPQYSTLSATLNNGKIKLTTSGKSAAHFSRGALGFHHITTEGTPIETGLYKLSITASANKNVQLRLFIRNEYSGNIMSGDTEVIANSYNWFFPQNASFSANASMNFETEETTLTKIFDFGRITSSTKGSGDANYLYDNPTSLTNVYGYLDLRIALSSNDDASSEVYITDVKLEPYTAPVE